MKSVPIKITVTEARAKKLRAIAKKQERTVSAVVSLWIDSSNSIVVTAYDVDMGSRVGSKSGIPL